MHQESEEAASCQDRGLVPTMQCMCLPQLFFTASWYPGSLL